MKKTLLNFLMLGGVILTLHACKKETDSNSNTKNKLQNNHNLNKVVEPDEIKFDKSIEAASYGLTTLKNNTSFVSLVRTMADEKFDGETNVLFKDLSNRASDELGIDIISEMTNNLNTIGRTDLVEYVDGVVNGFDYFETVAYLHIYIPFFDNGYGNEEPHLVLNFDDGNENPPSISNTTLDLVSFSESEALATHTWVIAANERVDRGGLSRKSDRFNKGNKTANSGFNGSLWVEEIRYSSNKEVFINGGPEISYVTYSATNGQRMVGYFYESTKGFIENWRLSTWACDATMCLKINGTQCGPTLPTFPAGQFGIIFFERDFSKRSDRTEYIIPGNTNTAVTFGSTEGPYGTLLMYKDPSTLFPAVHTLPNSNSLSGLDIKFGYYHSNGTTEGEFTVPRAY